MKYLRNIVVLFSLLMQCFSVLMCIDYNCSSEISISGKICHTKISPDGQMLAAFYEKTKGLSELALYSYRDCGWVENTSLKMRDVLNYSFSPDWSVLATIKNDHSFVVYSRDNDNWREDLCLNDVIMYQFSPAEQAIFVLNREMKLCRYRYFNNNSLALDLLFTVEDVESFELFFDFFVVTTQSQHLKIYNYQDENLVQVLEVNVPFKYEFSFCEQYFLVFPHDNNDQLIIYEQEFGFFAQKFIIDNVMDYQLLLLPNEQTIAVLNDANQLILYENIQGKWEQNPDIIENVRSFTFSHDRKSFLLVHNSSDKPLIALYSSNNRNSALDLEIEGLSGQVFFLTNQEFGVYNQATKKINLISKQDEKWLKSLNLDNVLSYSPLNDLFACILQKEKLCVLEKRDGIFVEPFTIEIENIEKIERFSTKELVISTSPDDLGVSKLITFIPKISCKSSRALAFDSMQKFESRVFPCLGKRDICNRSVDTRNGGLKPSRKRLCSAEAEEA